MTRTEYKRWKDAMMGMGVEENLNPQEYARQRGAGLIDLDALERYFDSKQGVDRS